MLPTAKNGGRMLVVLALAMELFPGCGSSPNSPSTGETTVRGRVVDQHAQPMAGVAVFVAGRSATTTDAYGNFTISNVGVRYSITAVDTLDKSALVYRGLSRRDPTLVFSAIARATPSAAFVNGTVYGGAFAPTQPPDYRTAVLFTPADVAWSAVTKSSGTFTVNGDWYGSNTAVGTLHALQYQVDTAGFPGANGFHTYGMRSGIHINDASVNNNQNDTLTVAVGTDHLTGTVTVPAGYALGAKKIYARFSATATVELYTDGGANPSMSYYTPRLSGVTADLVVGASSGSGAVTTYRVGIPTDAQGITVTIPRGPALSQPTAGATGVDSTATFSWTPFSGGVYLLAASSAGNPTFYIVTADTSTTLPNLSAYGLGLPQSAMYSWQVKGVAPIGSVDEAASVGQFTTALTKPAALTSDVSVGTSFLRFFTSAP